MLDLTSESGRFISAALGLAAEKPWAAVTLSDIAERAGSTLVALKAHFGSKSEIIAAFSRLVDDEMLRRTPRRTDQQTSRDALFEVILSRFDVLEPYKGALKSISADNIPAPLLVCRAISAQGWMLEAAGINSGGIDGGVRALGLATIYASVFRIWLDDEDPGLARTMAVLDRRLRRGHDTLRNVEAACSGARKVASSVIGVLRNGLQRARRPDAPAAGEAPSGPAPSTAP